MHLFDLTGRTALVTGSSRGPGLALAASDCVSGQIVRVDGGMLSVL